MMPLTDQPDPWVPPAIRPAPVTPGAQAFFPGADRATNPGFLGLALGQSASGEEQVPTTPAAGKDLDNPQRTTPPSPTAVGAAVQDRGALLAPWSASHGLLDYPVIGPMAGLTEYLMRGAVKNWQDNQWRSDEEATAPNRYYLPRPGERSPPSRYSGAPVGDALVDMIAAPLMDVSDMMQPPLRPPADSVVDDSRQIWVKSRPDSTTYDVLWQDADPDAAYAYYEDEQRRAEFGPRFALGMIGGGANFAARDAVGVAGGRLVRPTGQIHHGISKPIYNALEESPLLAGAFKHRDSRFETRAINLDAHNGWEKWHRNLDKEIATHIRANPAMTPSEFEDYLRERYTRPDLRWRFRDAF